MPVVMRCWQTTSRLLTPDREASVEKSADVAKKIGVLGGGQLGRMMALAGIPLGLEFRFPGSCG